MKRALNKSAILWRQRSLIAGYDDVEIMGSEGILLTNSL